MDFHTWGSSPLLSLQAMLLSPPPAPHTRCSPQRCCEDWEPPMRRNKEQAAPTACSSFMCERWTSYPESDFFLYLPSIFQHNRHRFSFYPQFSLINTAHTYKPQPWLSQLGWVGQEVLLTALGQAGHQAVGGEKLCHRSLVSLEFYISLLITNIIDTINNIISITIFYFASTIKLFLSQTQILLIFFCDSSPYSSGRRSEWAAEWQLLVSWG